MVNVIIFMGVDCTGKSTICEYISEQLNYPTQHSGVLKTHDSAKKHNYKRMNDIKSDIILDRSYMDEVVYAPVYRGYKADYIEDIEKQFLDRFNVLLVYVTASNKTIEKRFKQRGEDVTNINDIQKLKDYYSQFLKQSLIKKQIVIDTSDNLTDQDFKTITNNIKNKLAE